MIASSSLCKFRRRRGSDLRWSLVIFDDLTGGAGPLGRLRLGATELGVVDLGGEAQ